MLRSILELVRVRTMLVLLVFGSVFSAVDAQPRRRDPEKWEFSFFGGLNTLSGTSDFLTQVGDSGSNVVRLEKGSGWVLGIRISENLSNSFGAELEYAVANQPMTALDLAPDVPTLPLDQHVHNITYNGLYYPLGRQGAIRPFGTIGVGASLFQVSSRSETAGIASGLDLVDRWKLALTWGAGVKFRTGGHWGFRLDFRDHISAVPDYGIPRQAQIVSGVVTPAFRPDGDFHNLQFTAGFIYFFQP